MQRNELFESIKGLFNKKGFGLILIALLSGIALMLIPTESEQESADSEPSAVTSLEYCALLEQKAKSLICELEEVEGCEVFITLEKGYRYIYATDQHVKESGDSKETDKTIVLAHESGGEMPILIEEFMPSVAGVAVVCKGASYQTQYRIIELMCALFDIKSNRINVQT